MDIQQVSAHVAKELNGFGISLHKRSVEVLIWEIEEAIADGHIRSQDDKYSVLDFIRVILGLKSEREVWERFTESDPHTVTFCDSVKFDRKDGKKANIKSPASNLLGLLYIAYMSSGEYSQRLRRSSATYFVESRKEKPKHLLDHQASDLRQRISTLNAANKEANERITSLETQLQELLEQLKKANDKAQYFQAKAIAGAMLDRLKIAPDEFSEDGDWLWVISGISEKYYFNTRCKEDLQYEVDWIYGKKKGQLLFTPQAALLMLLNFRSRRGVAVRYLPPRIEIDTRKVTGSDSKKQNRRKLQSS